jgi:hypothetical protein
MALVIGPPSSNAQPPAPVAVGPVNTAEGNIPGEDILTRGPLHEAFAAPVNLSGAIPPTVPKRPPEPIDETPSTYRPEGEDSVWIPGYWDWDDQQGNFIWVSGIWRNPPPDHQWIGGYWTQSADGYQRTPGFWTGADTEEVQYFPQPPAAQEQGASTEAPSADAIWVPGYWNWQGNGYNWASGFWTAAKPGWVWSPTSYSWTPRGFVLVNGFWDYDLGHRGLAFAPVALTPAIYQRPGFVYTPSVVIDPGILSFYLFARPAYGQYYFGDYYGTEYDRLGFYPWYAVNRVAGYRYDPLFTYDRWYYRTRDPNWMENLEHWHTYYRDHPDARPPHTYAQEQKLAGAQTERADRRFLTIGQPVTSIARSTSFPVRVAPVTAADRTRAMDIVHSHQAFQTQRSRMEAAAARTTAPGKAALPHREHAIVGQQNPNAIGQGTSPRNPALQPGRTPPNMTGQSGQQPGRRDVYKPVVPGGESRPEVNPNREPPRANPQPLPRTNQEPRGNPQPVKPQPARPQPEVQPRQPQSQPQNAPRHPQAPTNPSQGRGESRQPTPPPHPQQSQPAPKQEHNQPALAGGGQHEKEKKPGKG